MSGLLTSTNSTYLCQNDVVSPIRSYFNVQLDEITNINVNKIKIFPEELHMQRLEDYLLPKGCLESSFGELISIPKYEVIPT